jgi:serine/threonine-protein kinase
MQPLNDNDATRTTDLRPSPVTPSPVTGDTAAFVPDQTTVPTTAVTPTVSVPGYEILGVLGRGGMGVVYKARHRALKRTVALKMILAAGHAGPRELARFRTEAEAAARLQHPNIVQVFDVGEADGHPYCALEFVEGGNLASKIAAKLLPAREAARLVETLARAVQLAHSCNVVHRDLKPSNILLATDGTPKITDFGLARRLDDDSGATQAGAIMGTPSYMAPEQASGRTHEAGPAADIYALGAILYECLTGQPPFKGQTMGETLDLVRTQEPTPPSRLRPGLPRDLETICLKCLEKDPGRRYPSAAELADDLKRYQRGEPITARPVGRVERVVKWVRRNLAVVVAAAAVVLALVGGIIASRLHNTGGQTIGGVPNPDAALHEMQRDLAAGKAVTLVGETGPPRWFQRVHGGGEVTEPGMNDGVWAFQSLDQAFMELLPDPILERYRFRAEVREDKPDMANVGRVGMYFCRHTYETTSAYPPFHVLRLEFEDENRFKGMGVPPIGRLELMGCLFVAAPGRPEKSPAFGLGGHDFTPATGLPGPWRKLVVEVRPDKIQPYWWDEKTQKLVPLGQGLNAEGLKFVTTSLQQGADSLKDLPTAPRTIAAVQPRSGLGLYAFRCKGSFRNVVIEPLPPDQ